MEFPLREKFPLPLELILDKQVAELLRGFRLLTGSTLPPGFSTKSNLPNIELDMAWVGAGLLVPKSKLGLPAGNHFGCFGVPPAFSAQVTSTYLPHCPQQCFHPYHPRLSPPRPRLERRIHQQKHQSGASKVTPAFFPPSPEHAVHIQTQKHMGPNKNRFHFYAKRFTLVCPW